MFKATIGGFVLALLASLSLAADVQTVTNDVAKARTMELESVLQLTAEGAALYQADTAKRTGYQYCSQAVSLAEHGEFRQAIRAASKALFLGTQERDDDVVAHAKRDLAIAYSYAGNLERAEQYASESLRHAVHLRNRGAVHSWAYKTLGDVAFRRRDLAKALDFYKRSVSAADNNLRFYSRVSLAVAFAALDQIKEAKDAAREAEDYLEIIGARGATAAKSSLQRIAATIALKEKDFKRATVLFRDALTKAEGPDAQYDRFWASDGLARVLLAAGEKENALQAYLEAVDLSQEIRARFRSEEIKTALFGEMEDVFGGAVELLMNAGQPERAWQVNEQGRSRALLDLVRNRATLADGTNVFADATSTPVQLGDVTALLDDREVLIEYYTSPTKVYAWVIRKSGLKAFELRSNSSDLGNAVQRFRDTLSQRGSTVRNEATALHAVLMEPLELKHGEALIIVPHGVLHYLPFHALHQEKGGYVVEQFDVSYAPSSATLLTLFKKEAKKSGALVALANPDLNDPSRRLPFAEKEVRQITGLFKSSEAYFGKDATKRQLLDRVANANVVHIAAHASVDRVDPLYSQIYLAGSRDAVGVLEAHEIYGMNLQQAGLVTLSACETGFGRISRGDEMWGFTRSFLSAGAGALIVSLWPVADESTEMLMTNFYKALPKTSSRASMRTAQLSVMKEQSLSHPFYWAAFNLVGDWR